MMQQIANFIVDHDPMMVLQRTHDTVRYIRWAWNKDHADPIDEDGLRLFLCDEHRGDLTEEQKVFARRCRDEMRDVYAEMCVRLLQSGIMLERGMVPDSGIYRSSTERISSPQIDRLAGFFELISQFTYGSRLPNTINSHYHNHIWFLFNRDIKISNIF